MAVKRFCGSVTVHIKLRDAESSSYECIIYAKGICRYSFPLTKEDYPEIFVHEPPAFFDEMAELALNMVMLKHPLERALDFDSKGNLVISA